MEMPLNNLNISDDDAFKAVTVEIALNVHRDIVENDGGLAGILNLGALESALRSPLQTFDGAYLNPDIYHMAAGLLISLSKNHPFLDGNKRTAVVVTCMFLEFNGYKLTIPESALIPFVLDVVENKINKEQLVAYLKQHTKEAR